ncbi:MAG: hypothetical protein OQK32_09135 [Gammaproteobacteria bacterium]|nr:hypothetical protein [Gammaproteobacteria bacterium]MCW8924439.1 hypothetical protein [Gammaproteobacteria bacterium]
MHISKKIFVIGILMFSPFLVAAKKAPMHKSCVKLASALESCERGPKGPLGAIRKTCKSNAKDKYSRCNLPVKEIRRRLRNR